VAPEVGYPVLLKAAAGGGGKGMRVVREEEEIERAFVAAGNEARAAFGDDAVYIEKYLEGPRHIEIQVLGGPARQRCTSASASARSSGATRS
jgi:acetyl/propionyl-CoA carboxylase alpha subunit